MFTHRPCTVPCKNCAGMAEALDFDIDPNTHNMLIVARIVPCLSLSKQEKTDMKRSQRTNKGFFSQEKHRERNEKTNRINVDDFSSALCSERDVIQVRHS